MKKIILDIVMFIMFLFLMFTNITGVLIHEILGIVIFILVILHIVINRKWLFSISKNIKNKNIKTKFKIMCIIDWLMTIIIFIITISGMILSTDLFSFIPNNNYNLSYNIHLYLSDMEIIIMFIHLGLHLNEVYKKLKIDNITFYVKLTVSILTIIGSFFVYRDVLKVESFSNSSDDKVSNGKANDNSTTNGTDSDNNTTIETLREYLSKLHCKGCGRNCLLSNPRCGRSQPYIEQATKDYYEKYGAIEGTSYQYSSGAESYTIMLSSKI